MQRILFIPVILLFAITSCKSKEAKVEDAPPPLLKKEVVDSTVTEKSVKGPIINLVDTLEVKRIVLCIKDSAATSAGLSEKLSVIFNTTLPTALKAGKLTQMGYPMVWYKSQKAPFFFEAGLPVDKAPAKLAKNTFIKKTTGDSVLIAHFFGPNELTSVGYDALNEALIDRKKTKASAMYEIYVNNPFDPASSKIDLYKLQTDIYLPYK